MIVIGDKLDYEDDSRFSVVAILDTKIMLNNIIHDAHKGTFFCTVDIKNFYLNNPTKNTDTWKYHFITPEIMHKYNIQDISSHVFAYVEICKGMYGIKEAGVIAFNSLVKKL